MGSSTVEPANNATIDGAATATAAATPPNVDADAHARVTLILSGKSLRRQHRRGGRQSLVGGSIEAITSGSGALDVQSVLESFGKSISCSGLEEVGAEEHGANGPAGEQERSGDGRITLP